MIDAGRSSPADGDLDRPRPRGGPPRDGASAPLRALRRRWWGVVVLSVAALVVSAVLLERAEVDSVLWLMVAAPTLAWFLALTGGRLDDHRTAPSDPAVLPRFGPGTGLSLARAVLLSLFAGFAALPWPEGRLAWLPMALYTLFVVADFFDGYLARRSGTATALGARLDLELDSLGTLLVVVVALHGGRLPTWYLLVGLARFLFLLGPLWRRRRGLPVHDLPPSSDRRLWAGFQMGFLSAVLWPIVPAEGARLAAWCFGPPFLLGFLRDGLVVVGALAAGSALDRTLGQVRDALRRWLPPLLRIGLLAVTWGWLRGWPAPLAPNGWSEAIAAWGSSAAAAVAAITAVAAAAFLLGTALVAAGLLPRVGALATTFGLAVEITAHGLTGEAAVALVCALGVLLLGSGALSLWQPEEQMLRRQAGRPRARLVGPPTG